MRNYQDTQTGEIWAFEDGVNPFDFPRTPTTLSATIIPKPSEAHEWVNGAWVLNSVKEAQLQQIQARRTADAEAIQTAKADNVVQYLVNHTPAEIVSYVNTNVTDLATAKAVLGKLAVAVSVLAKRELR